MRKKIKWRKSKKGYRNISNDMRRERIQGHRGWHVKRGNGYISMEDGTTEGNGSTSMMTWPRMKTGASKMTWQRMEFIQEHRGWHDRGLEGGQARQGDGIGQNRGRYGHRRGGARKKHIIRYDIEGEDRWRKNGRHENEDLYLKRKRLLYRKSTRVLHYCVQVVQERQSDCVISWLQLMIKYLTNENARMANNHLVIVFGYIYFVLIHNWLVSSHL